MTVGEVKRIIATAGLPDDATVLCYDGSTYRRPAARAEDCVNEAELRMATPAECIAGHATRCLVVVG